MKWLRSLPVINCQDEFEQRKVQANSLKGTIEPQNLKTSAISKVRERNNNIQLKKKMKGMTFKLEIPYSTSDVQGQTAPRTNEG